MRLANKNAIYSVSLKLNTDLISNSNGNPHYIAHLSLVKECLKASQFFWTGGVWLVSANENFFTFYSQNKKLGIRICKNLIEERSKTKTKKKRNGKHLPWMYNKNAEKNWKENSENKLPQFKEKSTMLHLSKSWLLQND